MNSNAKLSLLDIFSEIEANRKFLDQESGSNLPKPGQNGPYNDPETPVRNLCHWISAYALSYKTLHKESYKQELERLLKLLLETPKFKPYGFTYQFRGGHKDKCNGLIGPAWTIEALCEAHSVLKDKTLLDEAKRIYNLHPFSKKEGLWRRVEINGKKLQEDPTFNHQLWFAMSAALIFRESNDNSIYKDVCNFLDQTDKNLDLIEGGVIYHPIIRLYKKQLNKKYSFRSRGRSLLKELLIKRSLKNVKKIIRPERKSINAQNEGLIKKSIGYHFFNTYAFSVIKQLMPEHPFWTCVKFEKVIGVLKNKELVTQILSNEYSIPYNPPGYEATFTSTVFGERFFSKDELEAINLEILKRQLQECYSGEEFLMSKNVSDKFTHTARIYEGLRLPKKLYSKKIL